MELIITEKENAARRIAEILSDGAVETERRGGVTVYRWGTTRVVGLQGHVVGVDFPSEYSDWRDVEPVELIDAAVRKEATKETIVRALRDLARQADAVTIATDYDREGELIGKEAYELVREETDAPVERVRFSSITETEVQEAFENSDDLDFDLAAAGEARQVIDLVWGAALTRFLSLSARRLGDEFISVGRVQSPTLKLIVDREREIEAFEPEDYWELSADLRRDNDEATQTGDPFEAQYFYDDDGREAERVSDEDAAERVHESLQKAGTATVTSVRRRTRTDTPPAPFDTTAFISAAGSLGYSAQRAMSVAEELYTAGYITYPRTDNTVYPDDLDPDSLLDSFVGTPAFGEDAERLLALEGVDPTEGDEETTDHPPIHPTGELPERSDLGDDEWTLYELVVRRFFATVAEAATWARLRVVAEARGCSLKANGNQLVDPGYHAVYPYASTNETRVPDVEEGESLSVVDVTLEAKQTQPPRRYGQSRLIQRMEDLGLGTKCLAGDTHILRRDDRGVVRTPVEDLFEAGTTLLSDGDTDIAVDSDGPTTLSFEERRGRITERTQTFVSERPLEEEEVVLDITTRSGRLSVTGDHPLYVQTSDGTETRPASAVSAGDELLATRRSPTLESDYDGTPLSWDRFVASSDAPSTLCGVGCGEALAQHRDAAGLSRTELADSLDTDSQTLGEYETGERDVPVRLLRALGVRPEQLRGSGCDDALQNPFPLNWTPALARVVATLLGSNAAGVGEEGGTVSVGYHSTDRRLVDRFASDVESLFGTAPTVSGPQETQHCGRHRVDLPGTLGRVLAETADAVLESGRPVVPEPLEPTFVGALFDNEGEVSRDGTVSVCGPDPDLLCGVAETLRSRGVETTLETDPHRLRVRGRESLERFLDTVSVAVDELFYRGLDALGESRATSQKAHLLDSVASEPGTPAEVAARLGLSRERADDYIRELRREGYVERQGEDERGSCGRDRSPTARYAADGFQQSIYATLRGYPDTSTVTAVSERAYDGPVYDLTVDEWAPNFAVAGGVVVHNSTRHNVIEKLYDRGYVEGDPPRPTALATGVVEAAEAFADRVVSEEMTAQLEADMADIATGEATFEEVTDESREMLEQVFEELRDSREDIGDHLQESLKNDRRLGPCPECGAELLVRRSRQGSYFVGCDGFPDCRFTLPLPSTGEPLVLDETCDDHDTHHVKMLAGSDTFVHGCPRCKAEAADDSEDTVIGDCPECGAEHGGELAVKQLRSGSRLVGCTRYPDCEYSLPLPRRGDIEVTDDRCAEHDLPGLVVHGDGDPWELGCPICNYQEYRAEQAVDSLEDLDGVGARTAEKLSEAGVETLDSLQSADAEEVAARVQGISAAQLREWQSELPS